MTDLGEGVLLPGLVNAHTHLELSHLAGLWRRAPEGFVPWIEAVVDARGRVAPEAARASCRQAIADLEAGGTVAVGDVSNALDHVDLLEASPLSAVVFHELLAWDPHRAENALASATERERSLAVTRTRIRLAAHAPHSVSADLFRLLLGRGGVASVHVAESDSEVRFLAQGDGDWSDFLVRRGLGAVSFTPPRKSPVAHLDTLGVLVPGLLAVHCVQTTEPDWAVLARRGVSVALCPRSNRNLGVGSPPVLGMLEAGVRLCLGTDSLGSAETLDVLDEAVLLRKELPELDPVTLLRMATIHGAEALGFTDLGVIASGQRACFAFAAAPARLGDPLEFLFSGEARTSGVWPS